MYLYPSTLLQGLQDYHKHRRTLRTLSSVMDVVSSATGLYNVVCSVDLLTSRPFLFSFLPVTSLLKICIFFILAAFVVFARIFAVLLSFSVMSLSCNIFTLLSPHQTQPPPQHLNGSRARWHSFLDGFELRHCKHFRKERVGLPLLGARRWGWRIPETSFQN